MTNTTNTTTTIIIGESQGYGAAVTFNIAHNSFIVQSWDDENHWGNWVYCFDNIEAADECLTANLWPSLSNHPDYQAASAAYDLQHRARIRTLVRADDVFAYCCEDGSSVLTTRQQAEELGLDYPDRVIQTGTKEHMEVLLKERLLHHVYPDENGSGAMDVALVAGGQWCYRDELPEYRFVEVDYILTYGTEPWYQWRLERFQREGA